MITTNKGQHDEHEQRVVDIAENTGAAEGPPGTFRIALGATTLQHFVGDDLVMSHFISTLSATFPEGDDPRGQCATTVTRSATLTFRRQSRDSSRKKPPTATCNGSAARSGDSFGHAA